MAAISTGIDIVSVSRFESRIKKLGKPFLNRVFTSLEIKSCSKKASKFLSLAARFAAKEAFFKAVHGKPPIKLTDIEVRTDKFGQPSIYLKPVIIQKLKLKNKNIALSLAHEKEFAVASVVIS